MNKNKIKQFAIWARTELIEQVSQRAYQYGITADGYGDADAVTIGERALSNEEQRQRRELIKQIRQKGYQQVMEEVAYTWFNRFIALRFMEVNNYLPTHIRVFSDSNDQFKPEILSDVLHLDLPNLDQTKVAQYLETNRTDDLYRYLLLLQCNSLNKALPVMFEPMGSYTEMLLPNNILKSGSIVDRLVNDIPAEDWLDQVQIIGWLYQYYNTELNEQVYNGNMSKKRITKELLSAATTIYTPNWAVCYMVENSLGRLWLEGHPDETLKNSWQYYLEEAEQTAEVQAQLEEIRQTYRNIKPQEIKIIDPCMGSGHILVYAFDLLMQIYEASGVSQRDAVQSILANNLYGLDIDDRAAQLAYFAVMMKARQYDRRIFSRQIQPHLYSIKESNGLDENAIKDFVHHDPQLQADLKTLIDELHDATEYGAIVPVSSVDFAALYQRVEELCYGDDLFLREIALKEILPLIQITETMAQQYDVVVTNPPYMGASNMNEKLSKFIKQHYADYKSDFFSVFVIRCSQMAKSNGYLGFFTPYVWMFIQSYEKMRQYLYTNTTIETLIQFEYSAFEEATVPVCTFTFRNNPINKKGCYLRLTEFRGGMEVQRQKTLEAITNHNCGFYFEQSTDNFPKIPGSPIAYWVSEKFIEAFEKGKLVSHYAQPKQGMSTCDVNRFTRLWYEVKITDTNIFNMLDISKWVRYNKGGIFRKWYGCKEYVVFWEKDGTTLSSNGALLRNREVYFMPFLAWTKISSSGTGFRKFNEYYLFDGAGGTLIFNSHEITEYYLLGILNSKVTTLILELISPTLNFNENHIGSIPIIQAKNRKILEAVEKLVDATLFISKTDWDSFETSWDFQKHPLT